MTTPPPTDYYGKILKQFDWSLRKAQNYITYPNQFHFNLRPKETTKMNIQEKDCRRCEKLDEEGICPGIIEGGGSFKPDFTTACKTHFPPISGRDCRNCERFNGHEKACAEIESGLSRSANTLENGCSQHIPLSTSKPSPTVLTYTDKDGDEVRVIKGDKILSLERIWIDRPCGDEYRHMSIKFNEVGYNPDSEIHFIQNNLNLLSGAAFQWLLDENFFIKAEEEKPVYKIGQWFKLESDPRNLYVLCEGRDPQSVLLIRVFGHLEPTQCSPGKWGTISEVDMGPGSIHWQKLIPIDPPTVEA